MIPHAYLAGCVEPHEDRLKELFLAMYEEMARMGLRITLAAGGEETWLANLASTLERFSALTLATVDEDVVGFAVGVLRFTPDYLGAEKLGAITHVYVCPHVRRDGTGRRLVELLHTWFAEKKVRSCELQVLCGNREAIVFWERLGYGAELLQMRKGIEV